MRPVREEDIVILMRSPSTRLADYRRALEARLLRCDADAGGDFFAATEIAVLFALLQIIDNPRQDVPLLSVLRSPLFGFTADELAAIRAGKKTGDFYDALLLDGSEKTAAFLETLRALREIFFRPLPDSGHAIPSADGKCASKLSPVPSAYFSRQNLPSRTAASSSRRRR